MATMLARQEKGLTIARDYGGNTYTLALKEGLLWGAYEYGCFYQTSLRSRSEGARPSFLTHTSVGWSCTGQLVWLSKMPPQQPWNRMHGSKCFSSPALIHLFANPKSSRSSRFTVNSYFVSCDQSGAIDGQIHRA